MTEKKDIPFGRPWIDEAEKSAVLAVLDGHILTHGPKCHEFEKKFSTFAKEGHAVTTSSCMASLHLASLHFKLQPGDEVLVPAQTHVATVHAIELVGAKPVFIDCELNTGNIDITQIEHKITKNTRALAVVHFAGIPIEMDKVCGVAKKYNLIVIEDCALALGAFYQGKHVGLWGDVGCFSFYPAKHITTGEGGMLISKNEKTAAQIAAFRAFNVDRTHSNRDIPGLYDVAGVGLNYRMSEMQAALGCTQMDKLSENLNRRAKNFSLLKQKLLSINGVEKILDSQHPDCINSHYCLVALLDKNIASKRNDILKQLKENGIGCSVYYPQPVPRMKYYREKYNYDLRDFQNAATLSDASIALPVGPHLSEEDMFSVAQGLKHCIGQLTIQKKSAIFEAT